VEVLGYSWGVSMPSHALMSQFFPEVEIHLDAYSKNLQVATDGTIGHQAGDATGVQVYLLPYLEQDNLYKSYIVTNNNDPDSMVTDITDGTSNTMMLATRAGGEVVGDFLVSEAGSPRGIIAILIGIAADPSDASHHDIAVAKVDVGEYAFLEHIDRTNGIIAVWHGLLVDPSDASGNTASTVNPQPSKSADEFFSRFADTKLDDHALVATTFGRGSAASQVTHDMEFEQWSGAPLVRGYITIEIGDILVTSVHGDKIGDRHAAGGSRVIGSDPDWGEQVQSILHEDNEFYFPRM
jgi:hypothetical protein